MRKEKGYDAIKCKHGGEDDRMMMMMTIEQVFFIFCDGVALGRQQFGKSSSLSHVNYLL